MRSYLLDTNVVSELRRPKPDEGVKAWMTAQDPQALFISRVVLAEVRFGIERLSPGDARRAGLEHWLATFLYPFFRNRVLEPDEAVLVTWRRMAKLGRERNRTFPEPDLLVAATAETHGLTVVTRNVKDFAAMPVPVLNPWEAA